MYTEQNRLDENNSELYSKQVVKEIRIERPLDHALLMDVEAQMADAVVSGADLIDVDMQAMEYATASGAMLLIKLCVHAQEGQRIRFLHPNSCVRELLVTLGISHYIDESI